MDRAGARWDRFAEMLHHHHRAEDDNLWPVLLRHAEQSGSPGRPQLLADMEAEHARIDPALKACHDAFARCASTRARTTATRWRSGLAAAHEGLLEHLAHEEGQALPMLQRTLSDAENKALREGGRQRLPAEDDPVRASVGDGRGAGRGSRPLLPTPPGYGLMLRLLRPRYQRGERRAFRYA